MGIFQNLAVIGLFRQERRHELIANNLSNAQTAGFKKDLPVFHKVFSEAFSLYPLGSFETSVTSFQQGDLQATQNPLDLAIEGEGFFKVKTPHVITGVLGTEFGCHVTDHMTHVRVVSGRVSCECAGEARLVDGNQSAVCDGKNPPNVIDQLGAMDEKLRKALVDYVKGGMIGKRRLPTVLRTY